MSAVRLRLFSWRARERVWPKVTGCADGVDTLGKVVIALIDMLLLSIVGCQCTITLRVGGACSRSRFCAVSRFVLFRYSRRIGEGACILAPTFIMGRPRRTCQYYVLLSTLALFYLQQCCGIESNFSSRARFASS